MEMCGRSLYFRRIVEYDAGSPPQSRVAVMEELSAPTKKRKPITLRSAHSPVIRLSQLLVPQ